jgi:hypothetical protein
MGNDAYTKQRPKRLLQWLPTEVLTTTRAMAQWARKNYDSVIFLIGGNARLWGEQEKYNLHMEQMRNAAREGGVLVLAGSTMFWSIVTDASGTVTEDAMASELPDKWHPRDTTANRTTMARFISQCVYLSLSLPTQINTESTMIFSEEEYRTFKARLEEVKVTKGCAYLPMEATQPADPPHREVFLKREQDTNVGSDPNVTAVDETPAKKSKTSDVEEVVKVSDSPDYDPPEEEPKHTKGASSGSEQLMTGSNLSHIDLQPASTKAAIAQEVLQAVNDIEVFYPILDDSILIENDISLDQWLELEKKDREDWRDCYDPERQNRQNGFTRDNIDSVINKVLMKAIFQAVRTSDVNHLKPDLSRPKPKTLLKANLVSEVLPPSQTDLGIGGYSGASSSAAASSSSAPAVSTGGNTSANKPAQRKKDIQQLKLDTVEQNLTKRRQNARIIEDETKG